MASTSIVSFDWLPGTWRVRPIIGFTKLTDDEIGSGKYPHLIDLVWFRFGPLDINFNWGGIR